MITTRTFLIATQLTATEQRESESEALFEQSLEILIDFYLIVIENVC